MANFVLLCVINFLFSSSVCVINLIFSFNFMVQWEPLSSAPPFSRQVCRWCRLFSSFSAIWHVGFYNALVCGSTTVASNLIDGHSIRRGLFLLVLKTQSGVVLTTVGTHLWFALKFAPDHFRKEVVVWPLKACYWFEVGIPMFWLSDHYPGLLRSAGIKIKVCFLQTIAALISVSILMIDFGLF